MTNFLKNYWQQATLVVYNMAIFARLQAVADQVPNFINGILSSTPIISLLAFAGIDNTSAITNVVNGLPWIWIVSSVVLTLAMTLFKIVGKIIIAGVVLFVGYSLIF
jgi:hypothetical protein